MNILVLFVQSGEVVPEMVTKFCNFLQNNLPECTFQLLVIDNSITSEYYQKIDGIHYVNGNPDCGEFSAWDKVLTQLGDQIYNFDLICLASAAVFLDDTLPLGNITKEMLLKVKKVKALCGKIDTLKEAVTLDGVSFNRTIRATLFFISPFALSTLHSLVTYKSDDVFTGHIDFPFSATTNMSQNLQENILSYLTDRQNFSSGEGWLTPDTMPWFETQALALLNSYALTLRLLAEHIPIVDISASAVEEQNQTLHIVSPVRDFECYNRHFIANIVLDDERITLFPIDNTKQNNGIPHIYNNFIDNFIRQARGWLCFCHQDFRWLENPVEICKKLDISILYGVAGGRLVMNSDGKYVQEFLVKILQPSHSGTTTEILGVGFPDNALVDALDCVMLLVHSDIFLEYPLRFDEALSFHQYVDDLCLQGKKLFDIPSRVLRIHCYHESNAELSITESFQQSLAYMAQKHADIKAAGNCSVYGVEQCLKLDVAVRKTNFLAQKISEQKTSINATDYNNAVVLAADMILQGDRVLDVGCLSEEAGGFIKKKCSAMLWGLEFNNNSNLIAKKNNYEAINKVDLNNFVTHTFPQYYRFFDVLFFENVLAHIYDPLDVLLKCKNFIKYDGFAIVSMKNMMHMNVILDLLDGNFYMCDSGILENTHIRFFTWKSLAALFAKASFEVVEANVTFASPDELKIFSLPKTLSPGTYQNFLKNIHYFVFQYVCKLKHSCLNYEELLAKNLNILFSSVHNNPKAFSQRQTAFLAVGEYSKNKFDRDTIKSIFREVTTNESLYIAIIESGLFNIDWYVVNYTDSGYSDYHPLLHYLKHGWKYGWNPSELFDTQWYIDEYLDVAESGQCPLLHYVTIGLFEDRHISEQDKNTDKNILYIPSEDDLQERSSLYLPITQNTICKPDATRLLAFYLPQYYPFELNNQFWGEGFTDWRNVASAKPLFKGHYQPHVPIDIGFYDLRLEENALRQFELANMYGIHGFCYYYYWFNGNRLMEMPIFRHLNNKQYEFPYCLCWCPETWKKTWHSADNAIMLEQPPFIDAKRFFYDLLPFLQDERYIRIENKPLLMIYHPTFFDKLIFIEFIDKLRQLALSHGVGDLHIVFAKSYVQQANYTTPQDLAGDAFADFPPHGTTYPFNKEIEFYDPSLRGQHHIFDMRRVVEEMRARPHFDYMHYPTVFPMWDNAARSGSARSWTFLNASPELYQTWLKDSIKYVKAYPSPENHIVFINAWNEWAEGAHLEPDKRYGYAFLDATKQAIECS